MKKIQLNDNSLFSNEELDILPVYYRFLIKRKITEVNELRAKAKFSTSLQHQSDKYITKGDVKPVSNLTE